MRPIYEATYDEPIEEEEVSVLDGLEDEDMDMFCDANIEADEEEAFQAWEDYYEENDFPKDSMKESFFSKYISTFQDANDFARWVEEHQKSEGIIFDVSDVIFLKLPSEKLAVFFD